MTTKKSKTFLAVAAEGVSSSNGFKRRIASFFQTLAVIAVAIPGGQGAAVILTTIAGLFGAVGVLHATATATLNKNVLATIASFFTAVALTIQQFPSLAAYYPAAEFIASLFAAFATGSAISGGKG